MMGARARQYQRQRWLSKAIDPRERQAAGGVILHPPLPLPPLLPLPTHQRVLFEGTNKEDKEIKIDITCRHDPVYLVRVAHSKAW